MLERGLKAIVLSDIPDRRKVWWEKYVRPYADNSGITIDIESVPDAEVSLLSIATFLLLFRLTSGYLGRYRSYDFIITFQANVCTAWIGILTRILKRGSQKHVVLQFHRKEKDNSWSSIFKYLVLQFALKSTAKIICSSEGEVIYYSRVLSLSENKFKFIPLCVDPKLLGYKDKGERNYILSAGKSLRDYQTLVKAVEATNIDLIIISDRPSLENIKVPGNVKVLTDISYWEFIRLMAESMLVVIPLQDRLISTGQSVALAAMALGKAVVITKTSGTLDYVLDNITGIFAEPYNHEALRKTITELAQDKEKRKRIGESAREFVKENCIIQKYLETLGRELVNLTPPIN